MNRRTACDFDRPFGASVGNRRRSNMSSALSDTSYDEGPELSPTAHPMSGVRSSSMLSMTPGSMWASTQRAADHRVSIGSIGSSSTPQHRGNYQSASNAPSGSGMQSFDGEHDTFPPAAVSSAGATTSANVPSIPGEMAPPMGMPPVSPFDQIDLGVGDEFISFDDLLKDLFGASMPDMTTG